MTSFPSSAFCEVGSVRSICAILGPANDGHCGLVLFLAAFLLLRALLFAGKGVLWATHCRRRCSRRRLRRFRPDRPSAPKGWVASRIMSRIGGLAAITAPKCAG